jgi:hypothetical protein
LCITIWAEARQEIEQLRSKNPASKQNEEFQEILESGTVNQFISCRKEILSNPYAEFRVIPNSSEARAFGLIEPWSHNPEMISLTERGRVFFQWLLLHASRGE